MPQFRYKAVNASGAKVSGSIEGESQAAAIKLLSLQGIFATDLRIAEDSSKTAKVSGRVPMLELALFLRQMATLINSGVPLVQSLTILERQVASGVLREIISQVCVEVQGGADFSRALGRYPKVFSPLIVSMVRVGETGGVLGGILNELAGITERDQQTRSEVRAAMIYPVAVVMVGVLVVALLMTMVVPKLMLVFSDMGMALPVPTRMLLAISAGVKSYWWAGALTIAALFAALRFWRATEDGRMKYDWMMLHLPVLGELAKKASISRFSRALGVLLGGGVPLLESLLVVKGVLANAALGQLIDRAAAGLREGGSLARQLEKGRLFPPLVTHMVAVGENTGNLDTMLVRVAETYEWQTQQAIKVMLSLLMPVMILALAVVVAFIALALVLPLFSMNQQLMG
ncbi:MAG: Type II secretion system protein F [candidate division BRC1 bacterium ADurb.BinA364]|nr:MAG: Type II secretion system protein F [candidate division BRC1 bacterium ADurb.BinA364]